MPENIPIPDYQEQVNPGAYYPSRVPRDEARPEGGAIGAATTEVGSQLMNIGFQQQVIQNNQAMGQARLAMANSYNDASAIYLQHKQNAPDDPSNFTPDFMSDLDKYKQGVLAGIDNPLAQKYANQELTQLSGRMQVQAMAWQAQQQAGYSFNRVGAAAGAYSNYLAIDPSSYEQVRDGLNDMIDTTVQNPELRDRARQSMLAAISTAAATGWQRRDPTSALATLNGYVGIPNAPPPSIATPPGTTTAEATAPATAGPQVDLSQVEPNFVAKGNTLQGSVFAAANDALRSGQSTFTVPKAGGGELTLNARDVLGQMSTPTGQTQPGQPVQVASAGNVPVLPAPVPQPDPSNAQTPSEPFLADMPFQRLVEFRDHTEALVRQGMVQGRVALERDVQNQRAAAEGGFTVPPIDFSRFAAAYDPETAQAKFLESQDLVALGSKVKTMQPIPGNDIEHLVADSAPTQADVGSPDFARKLADYRALSNAANVVMDQRQKQGLFALAQQGVVRNLNPLNPAPPDVDPQTGQPGQDPFVAELKNRQQIASQVNGVYLPSPTPFTPQEAKALGSYISSIPSSQQAALLGRIRKGLTDPETYTTAMQQIAPHAPEMAMIGAIAGKGDNLGVAMPSPGYVPPSIAAETMLVGLQALKGTGGADGKQGTPLFMPNESEFRSAFVANIGNAFVADPSGAELAYNLARAYYVGARTRSGTMTDDTNKTIASSDAGVREAVAAATGGIYNWGGHMVIKPYGMPDDEFKLRYNMAFLDAMVRNGYNPPPTPTGSAAVAASIGEGDTNALGNTDVLGNLREGWPVDAFTPVSVGDGRYALSTGTGFLPAADHSGALILNVRQGADLGPPDRRTFGQSAEAKIYEDMVNPSTAEKTLRAMEPIDAPAVP